MAFRLPDLSRRFLDTRLTLSAKNNSSLLLITVSAGARTKEVPPLFNRFVISLSCFYNLLAAAFALDCLHGKKYNTVCDGDNF